MVEAVAGAPGALALLSFTASKLWELRDRRFRQLGRKAYRSLGGVGGALAQHAEATLAAMRPRSSGWCARSSATWSPPRAPARSSRRAELDELLGGGAARRAR